MASLPINWETAVTKQRIVCIIDNDAQRYQELQEILKNHYYSVSKIAANEEAFAAIIDANPDLILLSADITEINLYELTDTLNTDKRTIDIPVVFTTIPEDIDTRAKVIKSSDDLVIEPFNEREVIARVERQITVSKVRMALRESEAKFQSVMESAIDAIISSNAGGKILSWNKAAAAMFGYTEDEVLGKPIEVIIPVRFRKAHA
jgi:PleD family two-component response regulator